MLQMKTRPIICVEADMMHTHSVHLDTQKMYVPVSTTEINTKSIFPTTSGHET